MIEEYRMDLHIHSCLSPCAEDAMLPREIVARALVAGLTWIGIADHNASDNAAAVCEAAGEAGMAASPGMEVTTAEEIHLLAFFDEVSRAEELGRIVAERLSGQNDQEAFGRQLVVDVDGRLVASDPRLLIGATSLTAADVVARVRELGGIVVASHVDRPSYSIVSQLGFVPAGLLLDAVEVSPREDAAAARAWGERLGLPVLRFSDAHAPEDVGRVSTRVRTAAPTVAELALALRGEGGREVLPS